MLDKTKPELREMLYQKLLDNHQHVDMGDWGCGTVHCAGGWAGEIIGKPFSKYIQDGHEGPYSHFYRDGFGVTIARIFGFKPDAFFPSSWEEDVYEKLLQTTPGTLEYTLVVIDVLKSYERPK